MKTIVSIKQNARFQRLYKKGLCLVSPCLVCYIRRTGRPGIALGLTVSKKIGGAVQRNRAKRVLRVAARAAAAQGLSGCEMLLVARGKTPHIKSTRACRELCEMLSRSGFLADEKAGKNETNPEKTGKNS